MIFFFFSSRRRHTRCSRDWSSDVCSSDLGRLQYLSRRDRGGDRRIARSARAGRYRDRKSTRLNSSHGYISYAVFCLKKTKKKSSLKGRQRQANRVLVLLRLQVGDLSGDPASAPHIFFFF